MAEGHLGEGQPIVADELEQHTPRFLRPRRARGSDRALAEGTSRLSGSVVGWERGGGERGRTRTSRSGCARNRPGTRREVAKDYSSFSHCVVVQSTRLKYPLTFRFTGCV